MKIKSEKALLIKSIVGHLSQNINFVHNQTETYAWLDPFQQEHFNQ